MTGRGNSLAKQIGEHLVCAELGRLGIIATPFAGNVPAFDVLATDEQCRTVPIQVKATRGNNWLTNAQTWMNLELDRNTGVQHDHGPAALMNPELIYVCVAISGSGGHDRFFVLTQADIQKAVIAAYSQFMQGHGWKRPRKPDSFHCIYTMADIEQFKDNWPLITGRLQPIAPDATPTDAREKH
jgi:hypothetical protein